MSDLINILIRTSNRPELFARCLHSIRTQTYKNIRIIVSVDSDINYVPDDIDTIRVKAEKRFPAYYNLYCNELKKRVTDGWFFFLDDDDYLINDTCLEEIAFHLTNRNTAVICQFRRKAALKPNDFQIRAKLIIRGMIGMPCIFLHHSKKNLAYLDGNKAAAYRFIKRISGMMPTKFIHHVVAHAEHKSNGVCL